MGVATPNLSVQNWYSDSLAAGCAAGDNTLQLNNLPTPTEGFLIIDPNNISTREVIHYTGKTGSAVTGVTRGVDGTSAQSHAQNTTVIMNYTSSHWLALQDMSAMLRGAVTPELLLTSTGTSWSLQAYTPVFTNITIGNGSIVGAYIQIGKTVHFRARVTFGSTTSVTGSVTVTLPATSVSYTTANSKHMGLASFYDSSAVTQYPGILSWVSTTTANPFALNAASTYLVDASLSSSVPYTWATGDILDIEGTYEAA